MSRFTIALFVFLASLTALAQPGLCPCWLMIDIQAHHPHPSGHPELPHSHDYLVDLFQSQIVATLPLALTPVALLIALMAASSLWRHLIGTPAFGAGWTPRIEPPPPRSLSFHLP